MDGVFFGLRDRLACVGMKDIIAKDWVVWFLLVSSSVGR